MQVVCAGCDGVCCEAWAVGVGGGGGGWGGVGAWCWDGCLEFLCGMGSPRLSWFEDLGLRVVGVVGRGGLRWFGLVERRGMDDWVGACGSL